MTWRALSISRVYTTRQGFAFVQFLDQCKHFLRDTLGDFSGPATEDGLGSADKWMGMSPRHASDGMSHCSSSRAAGAHTRPLQSST
jgi:hypothetical protein